jgi:hypothetical protein
LGSPDAAAAVHKISALEKVYLNYEYGFKVGSLSLSFLGCSLAQRFVIFMISGNFLARSERKRKENASK